MQKERHDSPLVVSLSNHSSGGRVPLMSPSTSLRACFDKLSEDSESPPIPIMVADRMSGNAGCVFPHADLRH